jgi:hypothetical protein
MRGRISEKLGKARRVLEKLGEARRGGIEKAD